MIPHTIKGFFRLCFWIAGWKTSGKAPDLPKYVIVIAPHTSNSDFFVGLAARHILDIRSHYMAKDSLFKWPLIGWFLRLTGGHPVDRSRKRNMVDQVVDLFAEQEQFVMTVTPEGTRAYQPNLKTGFYRIAVKANVPIVLVGFDYARKLVEVKAPFYPKGDLESDMELMKSYFRTIKGRHPEKGIL